MLCSEIRNTFYLHRARRIVYNGRDERRVIRGRDYDAAAVRAGIGLALRTNHHVCC